ncbi:MAG: hypothetical protein U0930_22125 [Pirellulales bacterium]
MNSQNPFEPPLVIESPQAADSNAAIYRDGNLLVIQNGAQLPKICFVTGQVTRVSIDWIATFAPRWHYSLLLAGILPYFLVGPFLARSILMKVPCSPELIESINRRSILVKGLYLAGIGSLLFAKREIGQDVGSMVFYGFGISGFLLAAVLRKGGNLLGLQVVRVQGDLFWLSGIHPNVLSDLPDY